jgi:hypothetical protein
MGACFLCRFGAGRTLRTVAGRDRAHCLEDDAKRP